MTPRRAKMIRDMQLQRLAPKTQKASVTAVAGLATFSQCSPDRLRPEQMRTSLHHLLVERRLAWSSCHQAAAGRKFFSTKTLGWDVFHLPLPPRTGRSQLPQILSIEELQRLFTQAKNPRHRVLLMTTYAAGLRVGEVVRLKLTDIASERMLLRVEQGKGRKDRSTLLSTRLLTELRASWRLLAAGALAANGARWIDADPRFLFPVRALSTVFRGKFCAALAHACSTGAVPLAEGPTALSTSEDFEQLRAQLYTKEWVVYAKAPLAGPAPVLDYVGRSTHRVAIANHRLLDVRDGWVRFAYRNRRQGHRVQTMTLDADACIRRFLLPVLPHGFMRLRHDGFLANRHKARALRRCRELLGQPAEPSPRRPQRVVQWRQEVTGIDLTPCPHCGSRPLVRLPLPPLNQATQHWYTGSTRKRAILVFP